MRDIFRKLCKTFILWSLCLAIFFPVSTKAAEVTTESTPLVAAGEENQPALFFSREAIPPYAGYPYEFVNNGIPYFTDFERQFLRGEFYSPLDQLGRCGISQALVGLETMPIGNRENIGMIRPSGWHTIKYEGIDGNYLYNRCHLIGWNLTGENANPLNLITGTRHMNTQGMLPFENLVANFVRGTGLHVLYRVTPVFDGNNLVATGVLMEAESLEDAGQALRFCVFCYNVQPGIVIDYATGNSAINPFIPMEVFGAGTGEINAVEAAPETRVVAEPVPEIATAPTYIGNSNTGKFHHAWCSSVGDMAEHNKVFFYGGREEPASQGYIPCKRCNP